MSGTLFHGSLARIASGLQAGQETETVPREEWQNGDYVLVSVVDHARIPLEAPNGRMVELLRDDRVVGALGRRAATLEAVGSFEGVEDPSAMEMLTGAGILGRATSVSRELPPLSRVAYQGHLTVEGRRARMSDYAVDGSSELTTPIVLTVGTSMSAGKTTTARFAIRALVRRGLRVVGAKLTGAGRYRDILAMRDAGAAAVFDFVDGGLPSTICPPAEYRAVLSRLLAAIADTKPDVVVVEAGASPLEPYNGDTLVEQLGDRVRCRFLAASDPYAVVGVRDAFGWTPDLVTGPATSTEAAIGLVDRLTGVCAANVFTHEGRRELEKTLARTLDL